MREWYTLCVRWVVWMCEGIHSLGSPQSKDSPGICAFSFSSSMLNSAAGTVEDNTMMGGVRGGV